jgi:hypothetical protein
MAPSFRPASALDGLSDGGRRLKSLVSSEQASGEDDATNTTTLLTLAAVQIEAERLLGVPVDVRTAQDLSKRFRDEVLSEAVPV